MNEQIRQLAEQAGLQPFEDCGPGYVYKMEKFAQLVVEECMDVAKDHTPDTEECEYTWLIHDKIKQHFGVEE